MTNIVLVVSLVSGFLTILSFLIPNRDRWSRWWHAGYIVVVSIITSVATYQSGELARVGDIARAADQLVANRKMNYTPEGYVLSVLSFLEKNKDLYPDTYNRALEMCQLHKCASPDPVNIVQLSSAFDGIVKGLGTISQK